LLVQRDKTKKELGNIEMGYKLARGAELIGAGGTGFAYASCDSVLPAIILGFATGLITLLSEYKINRDRKEKYKELGAIEKELEEIRQNRK